MLPQKYFPVFARVRIQAPHVFAQQVVPQEIFPACIGFVPGGILLFVCFFLCENLKVSADVRFKSILSKANISKISEPLFWYFLSRRDALTPLIDGRLHVDDVDGLFGSRVKVQKRDCVYSIVAHVCRACSLPLTPLRTSPPV